MRAMKREPSKRSSMTSSSNSVAFLARCRRLGARISWSSGMNRRVTGWPVSWLTWPVRNMAAALLLAKVIRLVGPTMRMALLTMLRIESVRVLFIVPLSRQAGQKLVLLHQRRATLLNDEGLQVTVGPDIQIEK